MFVESRGTGPALVMIHGWAMHSAIFAPLVERLEHEFTLHLVDLPGHGRSRDDHRALHLIDLADALTEQLPPALWLGWSLGGLVALQAAQRHPRQVRGLAMICASPRFVKTTDWPEGMAPAVFSGFARELERDYRGTLDRFLALEAQGSDHMREELRLLRDQVYAYGEPEARVLCEGLQLLEDSDLREALPMLSMPSLWLAGRRDRLVSPRAMQAAADRVRGARYVEISSGGHAPFLTHADEVVPALRELVARAFGLEATAP